MHVFSSTWKWYVLHKVGEFKIVLTNNSSSDISYHNLLISFKAHGHWFHFNSNSDLSNQNLLISIKAHGHCHISIDY